MLTLTPKGQKIHDQIVPIIKAIEDEMIAAIGPARLQDMMTMLGKIERRLDEALAADSKA